MRHRIRIQRTYVLAADKLGVIFVKDIRHAQPHAPAVFKLKSAVNVHRRKALSRFALVDAKAGGFIKISPILLCYVAHRRADVVLPKLA